MKTDWPKAEPDPDYRDPDHLTITRPFAIFIEPDGNGCWVAHIVGHQLDNCTQGDSPHDAIKMMADLVRILTGKESK